jgi:tRNA-dihydrouridine synthase
MSFWSKLAKPIYCVAPMANVTDVAFRRVITDLAKPTVRALGIELALVLK